RAGFTGEQPPIRFPGPPVFRCDIVSFVPDPYGRHRHGRWARVSLAAGQYVSDVRRAAAFHPEHRAVHLRVHSIPAVRGASGHSTFDARRELATVRNRPSSIAW